MLLTAVTFWKGKCLMKAAWMMTSTVRIRKGTKEEHNHQNSIGSTCQPLGCFFCDGARPWKVQKKCLQGRLIESSSGYITQGEMVAIMKFTRWGLTFFISRNIGVLRGSFISAEDGMVTYEAFIDQYPWPLHQVDDQRKLCVSPSPSWCHLQ